VSPSERAILERLQSRRQELDARAREIDIRENLLKAAVLTVFKARVSPNEVRDVVAAFDEGLLAHTGEDLSSADEAALVTEVAAMRPTILGLTDGDESPAAVASAVEFMLEGLHLSKRLNKDAAGAKATYRARA